MPYPDYLFDGMPRCTFVKRGNELSESLISIKKSEVHPGYWFVSQALDGVLTSLMKPIVRKGAERLLYSWGVSEDAKWEEGGM